MRPRRLNCTTMLNRISVGPAIVTVHQGETFMVTSEDGEISPERELGLFCCDTRLISRYRLLIDGQRWRLATAAPVSYYGACYYFVSPQLRSRRQSLPERKLELRLERAIDGGVHEDFDLTNYSGECVALHFEIELESDFADLFDVKKHQLMERGQIDSYWDRRRYALVARYRHGKFRRALRYQIKCQDSRPHYANGKIRFDLQLPPGAAWHACAFAIPVIDGVARRPGRKCHQAAQGDARIHRLQRAWQRSTTRIATPNSDVQRAYEQGVYDIGGLRLYQHERKDALWMPAAGVPWFVTVFGRDGALVALQTLPVNYALARDTLRRLAQFQARKRDDFRDAQPGKILHEIRFGELAHLGLIPHSPYYGTADATVLYLILLSEVYRWSADAALVRELRGVVLRCLEWIDRYGDLDGDGFQEYRSFSSQGYRNQGWKDADNAVVYPDGRLVEPAIATCELQGYVYDAKLRVAQLFEQVFGERASARQLRAQAARLKQRFNSAFWMEREGCYGYALDAKKQLVRSIASNCGHLLWSGIIDPPERAARVMQRLLQPDMYSGWGIRTLSKRHPAFNPHDYQVGAVWPHDNALIAAGAKRYGLWRQANQIALGIFEACAAFRSYRLPELFAGVERTPGAFPVQYLGANIPQGWATGSIFLLLQTLLGIRADAPANVLHIDPTLPPWLRDITLENLQIGPHRLSIRFEAAAERARYQVLHNPGGVRVEPGPNPPAS